MKELTYVALSVILMSVLFFLIIRKEELRINIPHNTINYEPAIVDFLKNDFITSHGCIRLLMVELFDSQKLLMVKQNNQVIILPSKKKYRQKLSDIERIFVTYIMTCGNGDYVELQTLIEHLQNPSKYDILLETYNQAVLEVAQANGLYDFGPTKKGLHQANLYQNKHRDLSFLDRYQNPEIIQLLDVFDQNLSS